jgi:hypothetical protein
MRPSRALGVAVAALEVLLAPTAPSGRPPAPDDLSEDPDADEGLLWDRGVCE